MRGVRFYFRTTGVGEAVEISAIIFKISTGIALLSIAPLLADLLMLMGSGGTFWLQIC